MEIGLGGYKYNVCRIHGSGSRINNPNILYGHCRRDGWSDRPGLAQKIDTQSEIGQVEIEIGLNPFPRTKCLEVKSDVNGNGSLLRFGCVGNMDFRMARFRSSFRSHKPVARYILTSDRYTLLYSPQSHTRM